MHGRRQSWGEGPLSERSVSGEEGQGRPTFAEQRWRYLLPFLCPAHQTDGGGDALSGEEAVVVLVCDVPYLAEGCRGEVRTAKDSDCDVASDNANLLSVRLCKDAVYEGKFCGCWRERWGHDGGSCASNVVCRKAEPTTANTYSTDYDQETRITAGIRLASSTLGTSLSPRSRCR